MALTRRKNKIPHYIDTTIPPPPPNPTPIIDLYSPLAEECFD